MNEQRNTSRWAALVIAHYDLSSEEWDALPEKIRNIVIDAWEREVDATSFRNYENL